MDVGLVVKVALALAAALVLYLVGAGAVRSFAGAPPRNDPESDLHPVSIRYRCSVCGAEVTMTASPSDHAVAPRHCMEEMETVGDAER